MVDNEQKQETESDDLEKQNKLQETGSPEKEIKTSDTKTFDVIVDGVAYLVKATPFSFNDGTRFYVSINSGEDHVFAWDSALEGLRVIDDETETIPDTLEEAISLQLQSRM